MIESCASAPGKVILFGEHAVVYGYPAIAAPVSQVRATAVVADSEQPGVHLIAPDLGHSRWLATAPADDPMATAVRLLQTAAGLPHLPNLTVTVTTTIPIASGLGSGAAVATAMIRALVQHLQLDRLNNNEQISDLVYQVERLHHGTPSGIDNTVVTYERPVYFMRDIPANRIETFTVAEPLRLLVADTGQRSATIDVVADVRRHWEAQPARFDHLFAACGRIAAAARTSIEAGDVATTGRLMQENHALLQLMTVSNGTLDRLVEAAGAVGALGAKLSGAGRGGNMIALVTEITEEAVREALKTAGARSVLTTIIEPAERET